MTQPHELARAIAALINSSPRSPSLAEIEALIQTHRDTEAAPLFHAAAGLDVTNDSGNAGDGMIWRFVDGTQTLFAGVFDAGGVGGVSPVNPPMVAVHIAPDGSMWQREGTISCVDLEMMDVKFTPPFQVDRIDPANLVAVLGKAPDGRDAYWAGPPSTTFEGRDATILHADPFVLISLPREDAVPVSNASNGACIQPNRLFVRWYDDETDCVRLELVPSWGMAQALAPEKYAALMQARRTGEVNA